MTSKILVALTVALFCFASSLHAQTKPLESDESKIPVVEFCDLMADKNRYLGKLVRTKVIVEYLISMEYVLHSKCGVKKPRVALGFKDDIERRTGELSDEMYRQRKHSLMITTTGVLQSAVADGLAGFGHYQWSKFQFEIHTYTID